MNCRLGVLRQPVDGPAIETTGERGRRRLSAINLIQEQSEVRPTVESLRTTDTDETTGVLRRRARQVDEIPAPPRVSRIKAIRDATVAPRRRIDDPVGAGLQYACRDHVRNVRSAE